MSIDFHVDPPQTFALRCSTVHVVMIAFQPQESSVSGRLRAEAAHSWAGGWCLQFSGYRFRASNLEAIASRLEAISCRLEAIDPASNLRNK